MKKLYFMRHGLTEMNVAGRWSGSSETPLTDTGREQARLAGVHAKTLGIEVIVSSTLGRAVETAEIVAHEIGYDPNKIIKNELLIERHFGELEGAPYMPDLDLSGYKDIEPLEDLYARCQAAADWIESLPQQTVLIVCHGSTGRALRHVLNPAIPFRGAGHFPNAEIIELTVGILTS